MQPDACLRRAPSARQSRRVTCTTAASAGIPSSFAHQHRSAPWSAVNRRHGSGVFPPSRLAELSAGGPTAWLCPAWHRTPRPAGLISAAAAEAGLSVGPLPSEHSSSRGGGDTQSTSGSLPVRLVELPGKGRGVVATRGLKPGELLLACRPLAMVRGPLQPPPQPPPQPRPPKPQPTDAKRPGRNGAAGAAGAAGTAAGAAAAACSEGALVAELQRLAERWGPRQAAALAALYRGEEPLRPAPRLTGSADAAEAAKPSSRRPAGSSGQEGGSSAGPLPELAELLDPWDGSSPYLDCHVTRGGTPVEQSTAYPEPVKVLRPTPSPATAAAAAATHGSAPCSNLSLEQQAAVVRLNATGMPSDDVLLAQLGGGQNAPYIGLWPAHAMINHSCAPNAVAVVSGEQLSVRCCAPVPAGGEVCISYAGALGLGPLALRRALLERNHRFRCACVRCQAEERVPRELSQLWTDIIALASQQLQPRLVAAAAALKATSGPSGPGAARAAHDGAVAQLLDVRSQAAKCCGLFEETLAQLGPSPQEALWLQAGMYPLYETRARCAHLLSTALAAAVPQPAAAAAAAGGSAGHMPASQPAAAASAHQHQQPGSDPAGSSGEAESAGRQAGAQDGGAETARLLSEEYLDALSTCLRLQGVANAGSDMHVQLAARYDAACAAYAARHPEPRGRQLAAEAAQRLERALGARYGAAPVAALAPSAGTEATKGQAGGSQAGSAGARPSLEDLLRLTRQLQGQQPL